jgi:hypothetical protein
MLTGILHSLSGLESRRLRSFKQAAFLLKSSFNSVPNKAASVGGLFVLSQKMENNPMQSRVMA